MHTKYTERLLCPRASRSPAYEHLNTSSQALDSPYQDGTAIVWEEQQKNIQDPQAVQRRRWQWLIVAAVFIGVNLLSFVTGTIMGRWSRSADLDSACAAYTSQYCR
jgi:hypothetical protein